MQNNEDVKGEELETTEPALPLPETETTEKTGEEILREELAETNDRLLRTLAEFDNFRKRTLRERENWFADAKAGTLLAFLPVLDTFERAFETECADKEYQKGIEMIYTKLKEVFAGLGAEEVGTVGEPFSPELHNAVAHVEDDTVGEGTVVEVFQKGCKIGGKLLRAAMVKVAN